MPTNLTGSSVASTYDQLLHVDGGPSATEKIVYSGTGVATALKVSTGSVSVDNLKLDGNTISSTNANGNITLSPDGTGTVNIGNVAITGGTISGVSFAPTSLAISGTLSVQGTTTFGTAGVGTAGRINIGGGTLSPAVKVGITTLLPSDSNITIAFSNGAICPSTTTSSYTIYGSFATTQDAAFSLASIFHYSASVGAITGGSRTPPTNQYGFYAASNLIGATNNYGFLHAIPASSGRWGFYGEGTAANHFTGATTFGTKFGYGTTSGVGGTVTQLTSRVTGVTLNKVCGQITLVPGTIAGHEADEFLLINSTIEANDVVVVSIKSGLTGATAKYYRVGVTAVSAGNCTISLGNIDNGTVPATGTDTPVISFAVIKAVVS